MVKIKTILLPIIAILLAALTLPTQKVDVIGRFHNLLGDRSSYLQKETAKLSPLLAAPPTNAHYEVTVQYINN